MSREHDLAKALPQFDLSCNGPGACVLARVLRTAAREWIKSPHYRDYCQRIADGLADHIVAAQPELREFLQRPIFTRSTQADRGGERQP